MSFIAQICAAKYSIANKNHVKKSRYERPKTNKRNVFVTPAANRYQIKGTDLADICEKQSGTKGPYSCFTGCFNEFIVIQSRQTILKSSKVNGTKLLIMDIWLK